jgi:hypothetical protein
MIKIFEKFTDEYIMHFPDGTDNEEIVEEMSNRGFDIEDYYIRAGNNNKGYYEYNGRRI